MKVNAYLALLAILLLGSTQADAQSVIAVSNTSNRTIHLIDEATWTINKTVGVHAEVSGLASDDGDQLFYYTDQTRLFTVPYNGGISTTIGYFNGDTSTIFGLAYHEPSDTLYGCNNTGIYEIDVVTGFTSLVLNPPGPNLLSGIDIDKWNSRIYVADDDGSQLDGPGIYELNLLTMNYESVMAPYPSSLSDVDGIAVNDGLIYLVEDGNLLGDRIHEVDLSSAFVIRTFVPPFADGSFNAAGAFATPDNVNTPTAGVYIPELDILDQTMLSYMRLHDISAGMLAVMNPSGDIVYNRAFGWRDAERENKLPSYAIMRLASVTKPITAGAIRDLISAGQISLNDRVFNNGSNNGLLTYTPFGTADARIYDITVDHLLKHEGGWDRSIAGDLTYRELLIASEMPGVSSPPGRDATVEWIMGQPLQFDPGSDSAYSNIGYLLLGLIVEEVTGQSHLSYLRNELFEPMGVFGTQIERGRTFEIQHDAREPWYNHNGFSDLNVFYPAYHPDEYVREGYGTWDHEARIGQGGLVASPLAVLKFLEQYQVSGDGIGGPPLSGNWSHTGGFHGTSTLARQRNDGINYVVLFNKRATFGSSYSGEIRGILDNVMDGIADWPDEDVTQTPVNEFVLPLGQLVFGGIDEIDDSDDLDLVVRRSSSDLRPLVTLQVATNARTTDPDILEFRVEGAAFSRGAIQQTIEMYDHRAQAWEQIDSRTAPRFMDRVTSVEPRGEIRRFIDPRDGRVECRVHFRGSVARSQFSVNIDQMVFRIE